MSEATDRALDRIEWKPNPKQALFLSIPFSIKEGFYGGGAGSGKSDVLLMYGICHRFHENPRFKQVFLRRTTPELRNEIVGRSREIYPKFGATYNKSDMIWTFKREDQFGADTVNGGAQIFLSHCEDEKDVHKFDSMEISLFTPDEITSLTEWIYLYITQERNRAPRDSGLPSITRAAGMPGGIGHTFTKKRFVDAFPTGSKILIGKGGNKRIYIHATLKDNEDHIDPTYSQSLDGRPEAERKAKKFGDWSAYLGQVFDEFRDRKYNDEPENALHCVPSFDIPKWWPRLVIGDWGFTAMTYILFIAISPSRRVYCYRELSWLKTKINEWAPYVKDILDKENPRLVRFCKSAGQDRGQDLTIQEQISLALGRPIELSNNSPGSRIAGKSLLHEYMRWKPKPVIPQEEVLIFDQERASWILRNKGLDHYKGYLSLFEPSTPETNIPKLQIFLDRNEEDEVISGCPLLVESIKACSYDKPKNNKPAEDVAEFDGDDPYDTLRYGCDASESYFDTAKEEFSKVQKQQEIVNRLTNTQDWTAFYRNMQAIDAQDNSKFKPIKRYKH